MLNAEIFPARPSHFDHGFLICCVMFFVRHLLEVAVMAKSS